MINPNDVNLIIFDMDGTIVPSVPPVYEAIKRAFGRLGWPVTFSQEDIQPFFGLSAPASGGGLYAFIRPEGSHLAWDEIRIKVLAEYPDTFREHLVTYPGVKETLGTLRKRGYRLAQYSNGSVAYLNTIIDTLGIRGCYDHIECVQEKGLTKPALVRKIREKFGGLTAAIVGDRHHDIEAARETGSLAIGALYGYGGDEPEEAGITINKFDDLLSIFDRRRPIFEKIVGEIERRKPAGRPFVIGISGIDCSGKTKFSTALENYLNSKDYQTQLINLDDFHNAKAIRYAGADQADNYFNRSFDISTIIQKLIIPLRERGKHSVTLKLLDLQTDKYEITRKYSFNRHTIVLFEGVFLFRQELAPYIDYKVFLDIPLKLSKERAKTRDPEAALDKYDVKYLPAQRKYLREYPPRQVADMVIDNSNCEYPVIKHCR